MSQYVLLLQRCNVIFINCFCELLKFREYLINEYVTSNQFWKYEEMFQYNSIFVHLKQVSVSVWWPKEPTLIISFYLTNYEISKRIWIGKWPNYWFNKDKLQFNDTTLVDKQVKSLFSSKTISYGWPVTSFNKNSIIFLSCCSSSFLLAILFCLKHKHGFETWQPDKGCQLPSFVTQIFRIQTVMSQIV